MPTLRQMLGKINEKKEKIYNKLLQFLNFKNKEKIGSKQM